MIGRLRHGVLVEVTAGLVAHGAGSTLLLYRYGERYSDDPAVGRIDRSRGQWSFEAWRYEGTERRTLGSGKGCDSRGEAMRAVAETIAHAEGNS